MYLKKNKSISKNNIFKKNNLKIKVYNNVKQTEMNYIENILKDSKCIELYYNAKNPKKSWKLRQNSIKHQDIVHLSNYGILCGINCTDQRTRKHFKHNNNITIVDIDFLQDKHRTEQLTNSGVKDFISTFGNQTELIKLFNTSTIKTTNNGLHLIFQYEDDLISCVNTKYHIDILNNDKYIVGYGSIVDGKRYEIIHNVKPAKMPIKLKEWIKNNLYQVKLNNKVKIVSNTKKTQINLKSCIDFNYLLTDNQILEILKRLPSSYNNEYIDWLKMTTFMKTLGKFELWDNWNKKNEKYDYNQNVQIWNGITNGEMMNNMILHILQKSKSYHININYIKYKDIPKQNKKPNQIVNFKKLGYGFFIPTHKHSIIKSDTGTGKTSSYKCRIKHRLLYTEVLNEYMIKNHAESIKMKQLNFISLVSRVSLGQEQYKVFSEYGIPCKFYKNEDYFRSGDNVIIQIDSIIRLKKIIDSKSISNYEVFLDEFNSLIEYVISSDTLGQRRIPVLKLLIDLLHKCKLIIGVDADISDICFKFLDNIDIKYNYMKNDYNHNQGVKSSELKSFDNLIQCLKKEKKFLLCCDSASESKHIKMLLTHEKRTWTDDEGEIHTEYILMDNPPNILCITGETTEYHNLDDYDKIIYSPKIIYGLDSTMKRPVYCFYKEHTISPPNFLQQISRCRNISYLRYLFYAKQVQIPKYKSFDDCLAITRKEEELSISYFELLTDKNTTDLYLMLLVELKYKMDCYNTNKFCWFLKLLKQRGFIDENIHPFKTKKQDKKDLKDLKAQINREKRMKFDINNEYYSNLNDKYLHIPLEEFSKKDFNKSYLFELFIDPFELLRHFNYCNFTFKKTDSIEKELRRIEREFNVSIINSSKCKIHFLNKLLYECRADGFNPTIVLSDEKARIFEEEYNIIFQTRAKKKLDLTKMKKIQIIIARIIKPLFPIDTWEKKRVMINKKYEYKFVTNEECRDEHQNIFKYRHDNYNLIEYGFIDEKSGGTIDKIREFKRSECFKEQNKGFLLTNMYSDYDLTQIPLYKNWLKNNS